MVVLHACIDTESFIYLYNFNRPSHLSVKFFRLGILFYFSREYWFILIRSSIKSFPSWCWCFFYYLYICSICVSLLSTKLDHKTKIYSIICICIPRHSNYICYYFFIHRVFQLVWWFLFIVMKIVHLDALWAIETVILLYWLLK